MDWRAILASLVGSSLVVYLLNLYRTRTRLRVWRIDEHFGGVLDQELREMGGNVPPDELRFEIENVGADTSLEPTIVLTGYLPKPRARRRRARLGPSRRYVFRIASADRRLPTHVAVSMRATLPTEDIWGAELSDRGRDDALGFLWFKTYVFTPTRGRALRCRVRSADGVRLRWARFWLERLWFRLRGQVQVPPQGTLPA